MNGVLMIFVSFLVFLFAESLNIVNVRWEDSYFFDLVITALQTIAIIGSIWGFVLICRGVFG